MILLATLSPLGRHKGLPTVGRQLCHFMVTSLEPGHLPPLCHTSSSSPCCWFWKQKLVHVFLGCALDLSGVSVFLLSPPTLGRAPRNPGNIFSPFLLLLRALNLLSHVRNIHHVLAASTLSFCLLFAWLSQSSPSEPCIWVKSQSMEETRPYNQMAVARHN